MIRLVLVVVLGAAAWGLLVTLIPGGKRFTVVRRVVDGDTIEVGFRSSPIRLAWCDAPRASSVRGRLSTGRLLMWTAPRLVLIVPTGVDRYGRTVAHVLTLGVLPTSWLQVATLGAAPWNYRKSQTSPLASSLLWRVLVGPPG